jgi:hypothetical protein
LDNRYHQHVISSLIMFLYYILYFIFIVFLYYILYFIFIEVDSGLIFPLDPQDDTMSLCSLIASPLLCSTATECVRALQSDLPSPLPFQSFMKLESEASVSRNPSLSNVLRSYTCCRFGVTNGLSEILHPYYRLSVQDQQQSEMSCSTLHGVQLEQIFNLLSISTNTNMFVRRNLGAIAKSTSITTPNCRPDFMAQSVSGVLLLLGEEKAKVGDAAEALGDIKKKCQNGIQWLWATYRFSCALLLPPTLFNFGSWIQALTCILSSMSL